MFKTLLLASFAGAGAPYAPADLVGRGYGYNAQCSSATKECSQSKQLASATAYCTSALPKVTVTKTISTCKETTTTTTKFTSTCTKTNGTPKVVTSTVGVCNPPPVVQQQQKRLVEQIEEKRAAAKAQKPACLPAGGPSVTAACKCLSVKQATVTSTTTKVTKVNTYTKTVKTATTVTNAPAETTEYVYDDFYVSTDEGKLLGPPSGTLKIVRSGLGDRSNLDRNGDGALELFFDSSADILWQLNANGTLAGSADQTDAPINYAGRVAAEPVGVTETGYGDSIVISAAGQEQITDGTFKPLTCSISRTSDGVCPLTCKIRDGDVNQGTGRHETFWFLGPPNTLDEEQVVDARRTYKTYAVTPQGERRTGPRKRNFGRRGERYAHRRG